MRTGGRVFAGLLGTLLLCSGVYAAEFAQTSAAWRYLGALVLIVLGSEAIYGAFTGKEPWILKVGPLP